MTITEAKHIVENYQEALNLILSHVNTTLEEPKEYKYAKCLSLNISCKNLIVGKVYKIEKLFITHHKEEAFKIRNEKGMLVNYLTNTKKFRLLYNKED